MNDNKLYIRITNGISVLNFNSIFWYKIIAKNNTYYVYVKFNHLPSEEISINSIITNLSSTGSGILHEIKNTCLELNKKYSYNLPNWMTQVPCY